MTIALYQVQMILSVTIIFNSLSINALKFLPAVKFRSGSCPTLKNARETVDSIIRNTLSESVNTLNSIVDDEWRMVISLNMSDPLQNCPSGWSLHNPPRSCGQTSIPGCSVATWTVNHSYSRVRGRAVGFASGSNDAFANWTPDRTALNYADGMNIFLATATPQQHVWTFAVDHLHGGRPRCPCTEGSSANFPDFVGSQYFCDTPAINNNEVWDGVGCEPKPCSDFNNPPWFNVSFNTTYTEDIEVRICTDEDFTNERVSLIELEVYVQ